MLVNHKPQSTKSTGLRIDMIVTFAAAFIPFLIAGLVVFDQKGWVLGNLFDAQTDLDRLSAITKTLIGIVALVAGTMFSQRFLLLEKIRLTLDGVERELREKLYPDGAISPFFIVDMDYAESIEGAKRDIVLIGLNLTTFLGSRYRARIDSQLASGRNVIIAIADPTEANLIAATNRSEVALKKGNYYEQNIQTSIASVKEFYERAKNAGNGDKIKLFLLPFAPTFSIKAFDRELPTGHIVVEIYPHRTPEAAPTFVLRRRSDSYWYEHFQKQVSIVLKSGREYKLTDVEAE